MRSLIIFARGCSPLTKKIIITLYSLRVSLFYRAIFVFLWLFGTLQFQVCSSQLIITGIRDTALYGYSFLNISETTMEKCLARCLENCLCMSFQMCDDSNQCQLCSSNSDLDRTATHKKKGCTNFRFNYAEVNKYQMLTKKQAGF